MHTSILKRAFLAAIGTALVSAQQSDLPQLSDVTATSQQAQSTQGGSSASPQSTAQSGSQTGSATAGSQTGSATTTQSLQVVSLSNAPLSTNSQTGSQSLFIVSLSALPTIAGAGIPTMIVPYTADAPFMQHSDLPEGTVFIAVGAVLAFLGACVLAWRGLVAWSINRSVKRAALASIRSGNEKPSTNWGGSTTGYNAKSGMYKDIGDSMSMEALTSSGKTARSHFKDHDVGRGTPPPQNLFFSPTAHARTEVPRPLSDVHGSRNSSYLPAGYYAAPNSHAAGGNRNTIVGGPVAPYARNTMYEPSPPGSPALRPVNGAVYGRPSTDQLRAQSRDGPRATSTLYSQPSNSSLAVGLNGRPSKDGLAGSRAPSAYLEGLFENHTAMASRDQLS